MAVSFVNRHDLAMRVYVESERQGKGRYCDGNYNVWTLAEKRTEDGLLPSPSSSLLINTSPHQITLTQVLDTGCVTSKSRC